MLTFGSLFAGIGGFDLGLERAGMRCAWQVEIDPFCQKVLAKHWPNTTRYADVREVGKHNLSSVDLICGGWPCQPFSVAGKRGGTSDDRYLWPEYRRIIAEIKPAYIVGENVPGIVNMALDTVLSDLENLDYTWQTFVIPACAVGAPHRRDRVWIIANATGAGLEGADTTGAVCAGGWPLQRPERWEPESGICRVANGVPRRVDRLRSLGNAVVPPLAEFIGRLIVAHATRMSK